MTHMSQPCGLQDAVSIYQGLSHYGQDLPHDHPRILEGQLVSSEQPVVHSMEGHVTSLQAFVGGGMLMEGGGGAGGGVRGAVTNR